MLCQAKARVTVGMVLHTQARLVLCAVLRPSQMVWSLCKRAPFSRPNKATEAMTPPFCSFSFRLHGFCIPCGQPCAETFELLEFNGNLAKTQKVLCEVFRSILSNSEGTSAAKLIAIYVLVTKGFVPLSIRPSRRNCAEILEFTIGTFCGRPCMWERCQWWCSSGARLSFCSFHLI